MLEIVNIITNNYAFLLIAAGLFLVFLLFVLYYWRRISLGSQEVNIQRQQTKADMADVMLVFQTMRDVVQKQKALARDFNQELDQKTTLVKRILQQSMEKNERLYEKQEALSEELRTARQEMSRLKYQMQQAPAQQTSTPTTAHVPAPTPARPVRTNTTPPIIKPTPRKPAPGSALTPESVERLKNTGITQSPAQSWRGEDLANKKAAPRPDVQPAPRKEKLDFIVPGTSPSPKATSPSPADSFQEIIDELTTEDPANSTYQDPYQPDPEPDLPTAQASPPAAQEAYRTLLNLPGESNGSQPYPPPTTTPANGHEHTAQLRQYVIEYSRAGMPISEIASELGIGKGEVRLILSLSQDTKP